MRLLLVFALSLASPGQAQTNSGLFLKQKQSLHDFVVRASKAKNAVELLNQSNLRWQKGFTQMREAAKSVKNLPQILSTNKGIEIVGEGQKISLEATGHAFSFLLNAQEIVIDTPIDLTVITAKINGVLEGKKSVGFKFFSEAKALVVLAAVPWAVPIILAASAEVLYLYFSWFNGSSHAIKCEVDGSYEIYSSEDKRPNSPVFKYKKGVAEFRIENQMVSEQDVYDRVKKQLIADGVKDVEGALEKVKVVIQTEIKARVEACKGKEAWIDSSGRSSLEKMVEDSTGKPMRPTGSSSK